MLRIPSRGLRTMVPLAARRIFTRISSSSMSTVSDEDAALSFAVQQSVKEFRDLLKTLDANVAKVKPVKALDLGKETVTMPNRDDMTIMVELKAEGGARELQLKLKWNVDAKHSSRVPNNTMPRIEEVAQDLQLKMSLQKAGLRHPSDLIKACRNDDEVKTVVEKTGLSESTIRRLRGIAELMQIPPITGFSAKILWECGVSLQKLQAVDPDQLLDILATADPKGLTKGEWVVSRSWAAKAVENAQNHGKETPGK